MIPREFLQQSSGSVRRLRAAATGCLRSIRHGRLRRPIGLSIALLGLLGLGSALPTYAADSSPIVGTWVEEVAFNGASCSSGEIILFQCSVVPITHHADGTLAEVDTFASGAKQSWGPGVWTLASTSTHGDETTYTYDDTFEQLQFSGSGNPSHYDTVWGTATLTVNSSGKIIKFTQSGQDASYHFDGTPILTAGYFGTFAAAGVPMQVCATGPGAQCKQQPPDAPAPGN